MFVCHITEKYIFYSLLQQCNYVYEKYISCSFYDWILKNIYYVHFTTKIYITWFSGRFAPMPIFFSIVNIFFLKANFLKIWIIRKPCEVPHKIGPARFSCFDVYWIQTDKQSTFIDMFNVHFTSMGVFMFVM